MSFRQNVSLKFYLVKVLIFKILRISHIYRLDNFKMILPAEHMLPFYRSKYSRYDKFLPFLAKYFEDGDLIIDVGANIGDTFIQMFLVNNKLNFICIEPDPRFFKYLSINIKRLERISNMISVQPIQKLVGTQTDNAHLIGKGGTKHAILSNVPSSLGSYCLLDSLLSDTNKKRVKLLKIDTDGYDWDVLNSSKEIILQSHPLIYFEIFAENVSVYKNYCDSIAFLSLQGYKDYFVFDNFGGFIAKLNWEGLDSLMKYVLKQNEGIATRTIHYFDVLTCLKVDSTLTEEILDKY